MMMEFKLDVCELDYLEPSQTLIDVVEEDIEKSCIENFKYEISKGLRFDDGTVNYEYFKRK